MFPNYGSGVSVADFAAVSYELAVRKSAGAMSAGPGEEVDAVGDLVELGGRDGSPTLGEPLAGYRPNHLGHCIAAVSQAAFGWIERDVEGAGPVRSRERDDDRELAGAGAELVDRDHDGWTRPGLLMAPDRVQVAEPHLALVGVRDVHSGAERPSPDVASQATTSAR